MGTYITQYVSPLALTKNLGLGCNSGLCSALHFLITNLLLCIIKMEMQHQKDFVSILFIWDYKGRKLSGNSLVPAHTNENVIQYYIAF